MSTSCSSSSFCLLCSSLDTCSSGYAAGRQKAVNKKTRTLGLCLFISLVAGVGFEGDEGQEGIDKALQ